MSTPGKQILNRLRTAEHVISSVEAHADTIADAVAAQVPDLKVADVRRVIDAVATYLEGATEALRDAETGYAAEQADDPEPRSERDTDATALADRLALVRELVRTTLGGAAVQRYGLAGRLPPHPAELCETAANAVALLRAHPVKRSPLPGIELDTRKLADDLDSLIAALRASLQTVEREARELHVTRAVRDTALARWATIYPGVAALLEGFYRLAERPDLADHIRPTRHRTAGRNDEDLAEPAIADEDATPPDSELAEPV